MTRRGFLLAAGAALALGGCAYYGPAYGPPPYAPAHGYRYNHPDGVVLVYDAGLGLYIVSGWPQYHYYYDGLFYRRFRDDWQWSDHVRGPWQAPGPRPLPPGLRKKRR